LKLIDRFVQIKLLSTQQTHFPILIIGGGPIGLACALEAKKAGIGHVILEKGTLVNSLYNYPVNMTFFSTSERLEIDNVPFVSNNAKPTRNEALEYYRRVSVNGQVNIHLFEEVLSINKQDLLFNVISSKKKYTAAFIIICTGFYDIPYLLDVPGEDLPKVTHYYKDPHFYAFQKVIVVGAQNSAVDAALETWRKGAEITMIVRKEEIGQRVKYWVRPDIINRIEEGSIKAYFNAAIKEIKVIIETAEGDVAHPNDKVIALTGYQPNLDFLRKIGIQLTDDEVMAPIINSDTQESSVENVFLAGVICGGMNTHRLFIENSREHAIKIINAIKQKKQ